MHYNKITEHLLHAIESLIGTENVIRDPSAMIDYCHDEFSQDFIRHAPEIVVKPRNTGQASSLVELANENMVPVTVRGGGTGLCGGCVPVEGGIVVSFEKMNRVIEIDTDNLMAVLEPGVTLDTFYRAIEGTGLFFPPHPGDENATIGGVIATNAGGARAVKYGVIRNFVRGLEVVLADGEVVTIGGKLIKNSSGYSLMNLVIGSEGTLGIVTKAIISLSPEPGAVFTLIIPYDDLTKAINTVPQIIRNRILPMAVEFVERDSIRVTEDLLNLKWPARVGTTDLMIIVDGSSGDEVMALSEKVADICTSNGALDVFVADTKEKQHDILALRSGIYEALRSHMLEILDITVPRSEIARYVEAIHGIENELGTWLPTFGHAADGNVHTCIMKSRWNDGVWKEMDAWRETYEKARKRIHELGKDLNGIVSGEHGIGFVKKEYLDAFIDKKQIGFMKAIKRSFDPKGILNPGKIFNI